MAVLLHAVPLAGVCRKERSSPVPQVRARPEEMRCVWSKRTPVCTIRPFGIPIVHSEWIRGM